ncbi:MAG: sulfite exporter TauE/SafE family protein [Bacillota bacterium]
MPSGIICVVILLFSAFVSGVSGFGFTMVALTLLSLLYDIKTSVVFLAIHTLTCNIFQLVKLRNHLYIKGMLPLLAGALTGVPAGVYILKNIDPWWIKKSLGVVIITFVIQQFFYSGKTENTDSPTQNGAGGNGEPVPPLNGSGENKKKTLPGFLAGTAGGALMGSLLSGGPPIAIYALKESQNKYYIKATLQSFFLFSSLYSIIIYFATGLMTAPLLLSSLLYLPATIVGTGLGILVFEKISFATFNKIVLAFITMLGLSLLLK